MIRRSLALFATLVQLVVAQSASNVTIQGLDPRIQLSPECSPSNSQCGGGWFYNNFTSTSKRFITFGPTTPGNVSPSVYFTFTGTAIYYYAVTSGLTASVTISLDGEDAQLVNLTSTNHLNYSSPITFGVLAWSASNLKASTQHTFFLQFAEPDALTDGGKWAGFDSIVYTAPPISGLPGSNTEAQSGNGLNGALIGGVFAGTLGGLIIIGAIVWWFVRRKERRLAKTRKIPDAWSIDGSVRGPLPPRHSVPGQMPHINVLGATRTRPSTDVVTPYAMPPPPSGSTGTPRLSLPTTSGLTPSNSKSSRSQSLPAIAEMLDPTNPESLQLLIKQQQEIIELLRRQGRETMASISYTVEPIPTSTPSSPRSQLPAPTPAVPISHSRSRTRSQTRSLQLTNISPRSSGNWGYPPDRKQPLPEQSESAPTDPNALPLSPTTTIASTPQFSSPLSAPPVTVTPFSDPPSPRHSHPLPIPPPDQPEVPRESEEEERETVQSHTFSVFTRYTQLTAPPAYSAD